MAYALLLLVFLFLLGLLVVCYAPSRRVARVGAVVTVLSGVVLVEVAGLFVFGGVR
ncbi:hypothetical protein ACQPXT_13565 [Streptomyces sp. CA-100214]